MAQENKRRYVLESEFVQPGYIQFVTQAGAPVVPAATGTNTIAYFTPTNIVKVDSDIAAGSTIEKQMNKVIQAIGKRKAFLDEQRFVKPDFC
jgi:allophanate hydrolase subunit 2